MGCKSTKVNPVNEFVIRHVDHNDDVEDDDNSIEDGDNSIEDDDNSTEDDDNSIEDDDNSTEDDDNSIEDASIAPQNILPGDANIAKLTGGVNDHIKIEVKDVEAFNQVFIQQRQKAINNTSYRSTIESWQPKSLQQLADTIKAFSKEKSLVDCHWIIFYWIAFNIEYDTVSYFSKDYKYQSAEGVFRTRKGVCAGYANIYKHLCDQLQMSCEVVSGYAKGYGFDHQKGAPSKTNHAWNAVKINRHWYLMESTWGAGHLDDKKEFQRQLTSYYFLPRPNEMIYHHLPKEETWQLLRTPIKMSQYMQMPKVYPTYFELNLELISPLHQFYVDLLPDKPYALVLIRASSDIHLIANLKLNDQKIDGGDRVMFDDQKQVYCCYFAPFKIGKHEITIYGEQSDTESVTYSVVVDLTFDVKRMPSNPISFPKTWKTFFDLGLEVISPQNTHLIKLHNGRQHTQIQIRTPDDVLLHGTLENDKDEEITHGSLIYFDRCQKVWQCNFAPDQSGFFKALILAKKKSDPGNYAAAVSFNIEAKQIRSPPLSYPETWQLFYDLDMKIETPRDQATIVLSKNESEVKIRLTTPNDVNLLGQLINDHGGEIEGGHQVFYDQHTGFWKCKFAPNQIGMFKALIMAKKKSDPGNYAAAVSFNIEAKQIRSPPLSYPKTWQLFHDLDMKIETPRDQATIVLSKNESEVEIRLTTPNDVILLGQLNNDNGEKIEGGHQVFYDQHTGFWRCNFAPDQSGFFEAFIFAKKKSDPKNYAAAVSFNIEAKQIRSPPLSYPETWQLFYDLDMKIETPRDQATIVLSKNQSEVEIRLTTPNDVNLLGRLTNDNDEKIEGGHQVFYDKHTRFWRCKFAPNQIGMFEALIMAKKKSDPGNYTSAVCFKIEAKKIRSPPLSYPETCQLFYDLDMKIEAPKNRSSVIWPDNASYVEVLIQASKDIQLSGQIQYKNVRIENGSLAQYNHEKQHWQLLFAPERTGPHELNVYAKRTDKNESSLKAVVNFSLNVTKLRRPMKFPLIYTRFETKKCQIYTPIDGILKKGSVVPIHCIIPGATAVNLTVDSNWLKSDGYKNPVLQRQITVGSKEVVIYAKYGKKSTYDGLVKYTVQ